MNKLRCLVSAGPTREFFDPVRFISNPSSGKMGFAIAEAARDAGWEVTLVAGPVALPSPAGIARIDVVSAKEMFEAVDSRFDFCDVLIMSAAVSDYRPKMREDHKVKKDRLSLVIEMEPTIDILKTVAARKKSGQFVVGFAAETRDVEAYAASKMKAKNCDMMVANDVGEAGVGFGGDNNRVILLSKDGDREAVGPASKVGIARIIVGRIETKMAASNS
jgi:phosphopantothenoylcysteine decarboxylase / phosphopantothenate---cysteine ligase